MHGVMQEVVYYYSFSTAGPSTPFWYRSSAVAQLITFQIPST